MNRRNLTPEQYMTLLAEVAERDGGRAICGTRHPLDAAHIVPQRDMKREGLPIEAFTDARNARALCRTCHGHYDNPNSRVTVQPPEDFGVFLDEHRLEFNGRHWVTVHEARRSVA